MVTTLQQASQEGNLSSVREHLEQLAASPAGSPSPAAAGAGENGAEAHVASAIDAKDAQGNSALMLAVQAGHRDVVEELLVRGADRSEVLASGVAKSQPEILALLESGVQMESAPIDVHGGQQLPDGTVSYMHAGYSQPFVPAYPAAPQGYYYEANQMPPPPPPHFAPHGPAKGNGGPRRVGPNGEHGRKESVNLPPPEVARQIPCRNFPNCRYGDQCAFAHPMAMGNGMPPPPPGSAAPSGSMSPPPQHAGQQQQMYYQPLPGYGYGPAPGPYGPGPQFYAMPPPPAPHMQYSPNGVPLPIHFQPPHAIPQMPRDAQQQHMQHGVNGLAPGAEPFSPHFEPQQQQQQKPVEQVGVVVEQSQPPQQDGAEPAEQASKANEQASGSVEAAAASDAAANGASTPPAVDQTEADKAVSAPSQEQASKASAPNTDSQGRPIHRRQSFNSFLHHHAVPFQPGHISAVVDGVGMPVSSSMPSLAGLNGSSSFRGGKAGRGGRGGFNGSARPRDGSYASSRLQCSFFAKSRCMYGDECRFPHIQADGTDARSPEVQARLQAENQQARQNNGGANAASNGANGAQAKAKARAGLPAPPQAAFGNAPLGPQAQQQQQQNKKAPAPAASAAPQAKPANGSLPAAPSGAAPAATEAVPAAPANGAPATRPTAPANKPSANGAAQASGSKANGANGARSGPAPGANGHAKGNGSTNGTTAQRKLAAQRVPTVNDFPALPISPNPTQPGSPALVASAGPSANGTAAKINFSAILSAPAPVKPKPEPKVEAAKPEPTAATEPKVEAPKQANGDSHVNGNGVAVESKESVDDFKVVKPGKKSASSASAAAAAATVAAAAAASQQKEHAAASEGFAAAGPTAVAA